MILFFILLLITMIRIIYNFTLSRIPYFIIANVIGMILSDFASGVVHWFSDTWGTLDTPVVGKTFIRSFREHHIDPSAICNHDIIEANGDNCMLTVPVLYYVGVVKLISNDYDFLLLSLYMSLSIWVGLTNQIHKWAHQIKPSSYVTFMQNIGLILHRKHHNVHHKPPFDSNYCITNGWCNGFLNFFWILEST